MRVDSNACDQIAKKWYKYPQHWTLPSGWESCVSSSSSRWQSKHVASFLVGASLLIQWYCICFYHSWHGTLIHSNIDNSRSSSIRRREDTICDQCFHQMIKTADVCVVPEFLFDEDNTQFSVKFLILFSVLCVAWCCTPMQNRAPKEWHFLIPKLQCKWKHNRRNGFMMSFIVISICENWPYCIEITIFIHIEGTKNILVSFVLEHLYDLHIPWK